MYSASGGTGYVGSGGAMTYVTGNTDVQGLGGTVATSGSGGFVGASGASGVSASGTGGSVAVAGSGGTSLTIDSGVAGNSDGGIAVAGSGGSAGTITTAGTGGSNTTTAGTGGSTATVTCQKFSFFVTSLEAMVRESGSQKGFGGNLGGLSGADDLCRRIALSVDECSGTYKTWRAFLSTSTGDAIDRVGTGPWYDVMERKVANTVTDLANARPANCDIAICDDLPNEFGFPNHDPDGSGNLADNHHVLTGSNEQGRLAGASATCKDWTSAVGADGRPTCGMSWPRSGGSGRGGGASNWIYGFTAPGCAPYVEIVEMGAGNQSSLGVGAGGGYGAIYCFALQE
jgi:hypothetical protein